MTCMTPFSTGFPPPPPFCSCIHSLRQLLLLLVVAPLQQHAAASITEFKTGSAETCCSRRMTRKKKQVTARSEAVPAAHQIPAGRKVACTCYKTVPPKVHIGTVIFNNTFFKYGRWSGTYSVLFPANTFPNQEIPETLPFDMDHVKAMPVISGYGGLEARKGTMAKLPALEKDRGVQKASSKITRQSSEQQSMKHDRPPPETRRGIRRQQPSGDSTSSISKGADASTILTGASLDSRKDQVSPATYQVCAMSGMCYVILLQVMAAEGPSQDSGSRKTRSKTAVEKSDVDSSATNKGSDNDVSTTTYQENVGTDKMNGCIFVSCVACCAMSSSQMVRTICQTNNPKIPQRG